MALLNKLLKGCDFNADEYVALENDRKITQVKCQDLEALRNKISKEVGERKRHQQDCSDLMIKMGDTTDLKSSQAQLSEIKGKLQSIELSLPNLPHFSVPEGRSEEDNVVVRQFGTFKHLLILSL